MHIGTFIYSEPFDCMTLIGSDRQWIRRLEFANIHMNVLLIIRHNASILLCKPWKDMGVGRDIRSQKVVRLLKGKLWCQAESRKDSTLKTSIQNVFSFQPWWMHSATITIVTRQRKTTVHAAAVFTEESLCSSIEITSHGWPRSQFVSFLSTARLMRKSGYTSLSVNLDMQFSSARKFGARFECILTQENRGYIHSECNVPTGIASIVRYSGPQWKGRIKFRRRVASFGCFERAR